ncbi:MAG: hypothetical protein J6B75_02130 [Ruminococcus sp.]|nr:hypothetical protein [Ruminococcus sp.]
MRDYQRKKNNSYKLPHNLYMRMLYLVRDYERIKSQRADILHSTPVNDGQPHTSLSNPTEIKGIKLAMLDNECSAIEKALDDIPQEYRKGIIDNICYGSPYPYTAHRNTYSYWRTRLLNMVAKNLNIL